MFPAVKKMYLCFKQTPKAVRILTYLGCAYASYALLLGLMVPAIAQSQTPKILSELLGRDVQIEKLSINPFLLRIQVEGFAVQEHDNEKSFVRFDELDVQIGFWRSVFTLTPTLDHAYLIKPQIHVARLDQSSGFNFTDILTTLEKNNASKAQEAPQKETTGLPAFRVEDIQLSQGIFDFHDWPTGAHLKYQGLNIKLPQLDSQALVTQVSPIENQTDKPVSSATSSKAKQTQNHFAINVIGADKGEVSLDGQFQLEPFSINGKLTMDNITLANFWPFAEKQLQAKLVAGKMNYSTRFQASNTSEQFNYSTSEGYFELINLTFNAYNQPKIKLPHLALNNISLDSQKQVVNVDALAIKNLWIDAILNKNGLDLQSLFTPKAETSKNTVKVSTAAPTNSDRKNTTSNQDPSPTATNNTQSSPWLVRLHTFSMKNTDINVNEEMVSNGVHWRVYPLSISTQEVLSDLSHPIKYDLDLSVNSWRKSQPEQSRGSLSSQGHIDAKKLTFMGDVNLSKLDLNQFQTYLDPYLNIKLQSGFLSAKGSYVADTKGNATYTGQANISNLLVRDRLENQPLIKWNDMGLSNIQFDLAKQRIKIGTIAFNTPYSKILIDRNRQTNIGNIVKAQPKTPKSKPSKSTQSTTENSKPFAVDIKQITIKNGSTYFADYSLKPNFASGIELLNGSIKNLSSTPGTKATVNLKGKIDKYAPVTLNGAINPLIKNPYLDLDLIFKSVELTSVNPYSGAYAGYYIDKGQLSLALNYQLENNQLVGENHVVIDQLKLGEPSNSSLATSLPLSLAIAILQDRHGVIDLGVRVSGDVNAPNFSFGSVIWGAFANVLTKAVTSPFSMLAGLAGSDEELNHINFEFGQFSLTDSEKEKLTLLAKALDDRPMLKLSIVGSVSAVDDSRAIAEEKLQNLLLKESGDSSLPKNLTASNFPQDGDLVDALEDIFEEQLKKDVGDEEDKIKQQIQSEIGQKEIDYNQLNMALHASMYNQLVEAQTVLPDELGSLAQARARSIKAYLVDEQHVEPDRVFILDSQTKLKTENSSAELTLDAN
ncbi:MULTISPECIES: DUF748 domain-containing protein [Vibrio]|uniref:DUF748 domain-containing protein n=1 Tax=Vibrio casei TaxID=673372 RepID=A0A368LJM1_9VIBR|nr:MULTISPECIES: DUF748 domain-containing protein [Vibrio]RCS70871.1 DUF748 domain-containing protein [Vibrio casei]SJN40415.1 hypothetical protein FM109_17115 [Vibrio casei]HBV76654.1 DUF748 domain-containing protein [Vibrio sp.]